MLKVPGKWLIFCVSATDSLKAALFMCLPQVPPHSTQFFRISR